jgi:MoxR-like ATPase
MSQADIFAARQTILQLHMAESLEHYIVQLVMATRHAGNYGAELGRYIAYGASPRATIALERCARAKAWLSGRDFVTPDDVQAVFHNVLRHRLILSYEAEAEGVSTDQVLSELLKRVPIA